MGKGGEERVQKNERGARNLRGNLEVKLYHILSSCPGLVFNILVGTSANYCRNPRNFKSIFAIVKNKNSHCRLSGDNLVFKVCFLPLCVYKK